MNSLRVWLTTSSTRSIATLAQLQTEFRCTQRLQPAHSSSMLSPSMVITCIWTFVQEETIIRELLKASCASPLYFTDTLTSEAGKADLKTTISKGLQTGCLSILEPCFCPVADRVSLYTALAATTLEFKALTVMVITCIWTFVNEETNIRELWKASCASPLDFTDSLTSEVGGGPKDHHQPSADSLQERPR